jgi:two-component system nitrate/nitrite response regulator NarL
VAGDLRVLVIADDPLARAGLAMLIEQQPGLDVVAHIGGAASLPDDLVVFAPDIIVWDLGWLPDLADRLEQLAGLSGDAPPVVALLPDPDAASGAWSAGAAGLLLRDASPEQLVSALAAAAQGLIVMTPDLADALLPARPVEESPPQEELTPREIEVLRLLVEGLSNRAIASRLDISEHTVKYHVNAIMSKLNAQSRTEAVVRAARLGLIAL